MDTECNKLVRNRIPEILTQAGYTYDVATMSEEEYQQALRNKLVEEALEAATASDTQQLITEFADLYEVIDTLMTSNYITHTMVRIEQGRRSQERGGFSQRIRLVRTISPPATDSP